jgi:Uma2 family endonuclease
MMAVLEAERKPISKPAPQTGVEEPEPYLSEEFAAFAANYPDLRIELTRDGELIIMPPAGGETGSKNADLTADLVIWNRAEKTGKVFDSSTGFVLPNGAKRSPDASWISITEWEALSTEERQQFLPLCPIFVIELRSRTDRLSTVQEKMREYRDNGTRLGWLIDPKSERVEIYRPGQEIEILDAPASLSGEDVLPGFTLSLQGIFN